METNGWDLLYLCDLFSARFYSCEMLPVVTKKGPSVVASSLLIEHTRACELAVVDALSVPYLVGKECDLRSNLILNQKEEKKCLAL